MLKVENLSKSYGPSAFVRWISKDKGASRTIKAVDNVSFEIHEGEIYGLLGPNGAGKSTIIKMIAGLTSKDAGKIYIDNYDTDKDRAKATDMIGAIIESPSMFRNMSAIDNLRYFGALSGKVDENKIKAALDTVGLLDRANDKVGTYSLGMKQRLGIAQAIMSSPRLLILDEPTNGLDPEWIINIRQLMKNLVTKYNLSILVCSHILTEMQALCDRVGILNNGRLVNEFSIDDIDNLKNNSKTIACYLTNDSAKTYELLSAKYEKVVVKKGRVYVELLEGELPELTKMLISNDISVFTVDVKKKTLEDLFKTMTLDNPSEGGGEDA